MSYALRSLGVGARQLATATTTRYSTSNIILHRLPSSLPSSSSRIHLQPLQCRRNFWSRLFGKKKKVEPVNPEDAKFIYPSSLCLYTAGRRTVWVGCMKLASCYPFLLTVFYLGPNLQLNWPALYTFPLLQAHPNITAAAILTLTALPMGMFYLAAPYVTHMFIKIPPYARVSKPAVMNWVKTGLTEETKLRIFTMRFLGRPKLVEVPLGELRFCRKRLGCVNLEWVYKQKEKPRVSQFYVEKKIGSGKGGHEAFFDVMGWVEENSVRMEKRLGGSGGASIVTDAIAGPGGNTSKSTSILKEVKKKTPIKKR
ncbi:hypothetical protein TWF718_004112 [Orbilia javanica]|uniref:Uncharacterized protein n=1 Tax=Orbilia javanica TaxID=47235 RepID=A0AAN8NZ70_9PEZI